MLKTKRGAKWGLWAHDVMICAKQRGNLGELLERTAHGEYTCLQTDLRLLRTVRKILPSIVCVRYFQCAFLFPSPHSLGCRKEEGEEVRGREVSVVTKR